MILAGSLEENVNILPRSSHCASSKSQDPWINNFQDNDNIQITNPSANSSAR